MTATEAQIDLHSFHSDVYKEVHGIRPRWLHPEEYTEEEWRWMINLLIDDRQEATRRETEATSAHRTWAAEVTACEPLRAKFPAFKFS
jgi:hypothetical protein